MKNPRRRQADRRAETHCALIRAAVRVIAQRGYDAATLQLIADAAGVSKGAVHHHFRAKRELIQPVLAHCTDHLRASAQTAWQRQAPPGERLRVAVRAMWAARVESSDEAAALAELTTRAVHDRYVREAVRVEMERAEGDLVRALESIFAALGLRSKVAPATLARLWLVLLAGGALHHCLVDEQGATEMLDSLEALIPSVLTV